MYEIRLYYDVKTEWGLGHIECTTVRCGIRYCPYIVRGIWTPCGRSHFAVFGYFTDDLKIRKRLKKFLGYNLNQAMENLDPLIIRG